MFQVLGHIDALKGFYPRFSDIETPVVEETLQVIADQGIAIEVNTSGKNKPSNDWFPSYKLLERALHYNIDISFGSDSHTPDRIADDFFKVQDTLRKIGFKEMVYFVEKKKHTLSL